MPERNKVRASYNQAEYMGESRVMLQDWADLIDGLLEEAKNDNRSHKSS